MKKRTFLIAVCFLLAGSYARADKVYEISKPSTINYYVKHTIGFSTGEFLDFDGSVVLGDNNKKIKSVTVHIKTSSLSTYIKEKEEGLKGEQFLNVKKYPEITIESKKIRKDKIIAKVTALGQTKEVSFKYFNYGIVSVQGVPTVMIGMQGVIDRTAFGMKYNVASDRTDKDMLGTDFQVTLRLDAALRK